MKKRVREMSDSELINELIETSNLIGQYSMESHNPNILNKREEIRYSNVKKEILDRMKV